jgi:hypothetical protein
MLGGGGGRWLDTGAADVSGGRERTGGGGGPKARSGADGEAPAVTVPSGWVFPVGVVTGNAGGAAPDNGGGPPAGGASPLVGSGGGIAPV